MPSYITALINQYAGTEYRRRAVKLWDENQAIFSPSSSTTNRRTVSSSVIGHA